MINWPEDTAYNRKPTLTLQQLERNVKHSKWKAGQDLCMERPIDLIETGRVAKCVKTETPNAKRPIGRFYYKKNKDTW